MIGYEVLAVVADVVHGPKLPGAGGAIRDRAKSTSVSVGSSQSAQFASATLIGIRSWMCPTSSVELVVITEKVTSQASGSSSETSGLRYKSKIPANGRVSPSAG